MITTHIKFFFSLIERLIYHNLINILIYKLGVELVVLSLYS